MHALRVGVPTLLVSLIAFSVTVFGAQPPARGATPCGRPDLIDMVPADGASRVPLDARLSAHYAASAEHLGEPVRVVRIPASGPPEEQTLPAEFDSSEGLLFVDPPTALAPESEYVVEWPALRGLNAAAPGAGGEARFSTGLAPDATAPTFGGIDRIRWDVERTHSDCDDAIEERMLFDLELGAADDDGGAGSLSLLVFQTAGPNLGAASRPVLGRAFPADGRTQVRLIVGDAVGRVCFAALARDATGKTSQTGDRETCVETTAPPFFDGCEIGRARGKHSPPLDVDLLSFVALTAGVLVVRPPRGRRSRA